LFKKKLMAIIKKTKQAIVYPNIPSALRPVDHDDSVQVPKPPH